MRKGDLVKVKKKWHRVKKLGNPRSMMPEIPMLVLEAAHNAVKVITPGGAIITDLAEYYEVISESR